MAADERVIRMIDHGIDCVVTGAAASRRVYPVRPQGLDAFLAGLPPEQAAWLRQLGFRAERDQLMFLPGPEGVAGAVLGLGSDTSPFAFGGLATRLPEEGVWRLEPGDYDPASATLGYALGAYRFGDFLGSGKPVARLLNPGGHDGALSQAAAIWMVRDLINTPANVLGPAELADAAAALGGRYHADVIISHDEKLNDHYPTVAAVGRGSVRSPRVVVMHWQGSNAHAEAPLISLCGKGVCFDTGGYDLKPSSAMLRMKKDMGGAANVLGLARMIMDADLPVRLAVRIGCVENSVSGHAMRPSDIVRTRSGKTVEIGNTDAEGRLVLCDLLDEAASETPAFLLDCATLTGAARVALGPDLPALFCNDDGWSESLLQQGIASHDPLWRLPLWEGYDDWLKSPVADVNNVSSKPMAGAITAALFLQRFIPANIPWAHVDMYAWNDQRRSGRPEGGEAQAIRAVFAALSSRLVASTDVVEFGSL
jgi:leucyl aminopeptidase